MSSHEFKTEKATVNQNNIRQYCNVLNLDLSMFSELERKKIDQIYLHDFKSNPYLLFHLKECNHDEKIYLALFYCEKDLQLNLIHIYCLILRDPIKSDLALESIMCKKLSEMVNKVILYSFTES